VYVEPGGWAVGETQSTKTSGVMRSVESDTYAAMNADRHVNK